MKSKKGSFLVEVVVALSLISTVMAATPFVIKEVVTSTSKKYESYIANETLDSIGKELMYNCTYDELESYFCDGSKKISYSKELIEQLLTSNIINMEVIDLEDNFVELSMSKESNLMKIDIEIKYSVYNSNKVIKNTIRKAKWIDESYK